MTFQSKQINNSQLAALLKTIDIKCLQDKRLTEFIDVAKKNNWSVKAIITALAQREIIERDARSLIRRLRDSKTGNFVTMADYDWNWPKKIDRPVVEYLTSADFVSKGENAIIVGAQGLGKTMITKNIAQNAVYKGHSALFVEAASMLVDLGSQDSARGLERRLKYYSKPSLLCIDEIGYLSYDQRAADFLYQIVSRRYEKKSIVITTNLAFKSWPTVFPGATSVASLIDRLIHHCEITLIEGESYRKRAAKKRQATNAKKREKK